MGSHKLTWHPNLKKSGALLLKSDFLDLENTLFIHKCFFPEGPVTSSLMLLQA